MMKKLLSALLIAALLLTALPLTVALAANDDAVFIVADGVTYKVHQGELFRYVYYLNTGEQLCSLEAELHYGADGLSLIRPLNEDDKEDLRMIFPRIKYSNLTVNEKITGIVKYNFSSAGGMPFNKDTSRLIDAEFRVTASSGTYEIKNLVHTVAGMDEYCYLYHDQVLDPLKRCESEVPDRTPYDPANPDPPTAAPTEAPTAKPTAAPTEAPTAKPTTAPTEAPTAKPTAAPTEAPTAKPTTAPTEAPTAKPTTAPTEAPTAKPTIAPTEAPTAKPTIAPTEAPTAKPTTAPTDAPTAKPTTAPTEAPTAKPTTAPTEAPTAKPTTAPTEAPTAKPTEAVAEPLHGDADGDGRITILDVSFIQRDLAGIHLLSDERRKLADVDGDGEETIIDGTYIQRWLAGLLADNPFTRFGYPRT